MFFVVLFFNLFFKIIFDFFCASCFSLLSFSDPMQSLSRFISRFICLLPLLFFFFFSPWYNRNGWLCVKHKVTTIIMIIDVVICLYPSIIKYFTVNVLVISGTVAAADMWVGLCASIFTVEKSSLINQSINQSINIQHSKANWTYPISKHPSLYAQVLT